MSMEMEVITKENKNSKRNTQNEGLKNTIQSLQELSKLSKKETSTTYRITALSDLHGHFPPNLPGGDILIIAGDISSGKFTYIELDKFKSWMDEQNYKHKIFIAGNHDTQIKGRLKTLNYEKFISKHYLEDGAYYFDDNLIWGTPWSLWFEGVHNSCNAYMESEAQLEIIYKLIPKDLSILVSHGPPYGILDTNLYKQKCGSFALLNNIIKVRPKLVIFGHIHEQGGKFFKDIGITYFNASIRDGDYRLSRDLSRHTFDFDFGAETQNVDQSQIPTGSGTHQICPTKKDLS